MKTKPDYNLLESQFATFLADRSHLSGSGKDRFGQLVRALTAAQDDGHACLPVGESDELFLKSISLVSDGGQTPLVLHKGRLYLHRYYRYEQRLAEQIGAMAQINASLPAADQLLEKYFTDEKSGTNWQKEAARIALKKTVTIVCGGPGTGKTTTVVKILALLLQCSDR